MGTGDLTLPRLRWGFVCVAQRTYMAWSSGVTMWDRVSVSCHFLQGGFILSFCLSVRVVVCHRMPSYSPGLNPHRQNRDRKIWYSKDDQESLPDNMGWEEYCFPKEISSPDAQREDRWQASKDRQHLLLLANPKIPKGAGDLSYWFYCFICKPHSS